MPFSQHALRVLLFLILASGARSAGAQPLSPYSLETPLADTLRALIIFTRFADDPDPGNADLDYTGWPGASSDLPAFARTLLSTSPKPPYADSTLTAYFHQQSLGRFVIFGEPYDSVLVAASPEARYHSPQGGYGDLTVELLSRIDASGFDFTRYDYNRDGVIDQVFIVIRGDTQRDAKRFTWTGASCLDGRCAGAYTQRMAIPPITLDGKKVDWNTSGSFIMHRTPGNLIAQHYHVRLMAHELGHDLWAPFFVHIPPLTSNDVPATSNRSQKGHCVGYVLMAGAGGAMDCGGHQTVSAFERDLLGWIDCRTLTTSQAGLRLDDLYTSDACFRIDLGDERRIYLTNHQRLGPFDRYREAGRRTVFEMGLLRTTGLLVTLAEGRRLDVIPADNSLDLGVTNDVYAGDLFAPDSRRQLTPWTRPTSNGHTRYARGKAVHWHAIDDIRYAPGPERAIVFDFIADARNQPFIREASWMGAESEGIRFAGGIEVVDRSTLHIEANIVVSGTMRVGPGSTLDIAAGASLRIAPEGRLHLSPGSAIVLAGELILEGPLHAAPTATITRQGAGSMSARIR